MLLKNLEKAIMVRSKLKRIANASNDPEDIALYKRQRNFVVNINRNAKKFFFSDCAQNQNSKRFWEICKPLFFKYKQ